MEKVLLIIVFNLILFFRTLRFSLCVDDVRQYQRVFNSGFPLFFKNPLAAIQARLYGGGTFGRISTETEDTPANREKARKFSELDHLFTVSLHTLASVLVYIAFGSTQISFIAAILYSCNPTNTQTSIWLNGRRYLVNVILVLTMVILSSIKYGWIAAIPLYALTGLMHVTAIFSPVIFVGFISIPLMILFYLLFGKNIDDRVRSRMSSIHSKDWKNYTPKRLIIITKTYGFYFFKMIFPGKTLINYPTLFFWGVTKQGNDDAYSINFDFYVGIVSFVITGIIAAVVPPAYKGYVIFMFLAILQWCAIIPATQLLADRYVSTAMPFMMFFLAFFIQSPIVLIALAGFYTAKLWSTSEMFESIFSYWKYQMYHAPHITTPRKEVIDYLIQRGDFFKAFFYVREGLEYLPNDFALLHRAAICSKAIGSRKNALEFVMRAEQNMYLDQEETQKEWCQFFKDQMKKEDTTQINRKN